MNFLVIGGAGFVGSCLCEELVLRGHKVCSYDNYFTGSVRNHVSGVKYIKGDASQINKVSFPIKFSHVFHLGEYSRVEQSFADIDIVFEYNMHSIYPVLSFIKSNACKLIYAGSSTKFGDEGENADQSPYAWTKKTNAELVKTFCTWFGIEYAITYFYNVYGNREISSGKYATVIAKFIELAKSNSSELPVVRPGSQKRNFTHIDDIISALYLIALNGEGDGYGIGSDEIISIEELVTDIFKKKIRWVDMRKGNRLSAPVVSKKTKELGWRPRCSLESYIKNALNLP